MSDSVKMAVETIWAAMGIAEPPEQIGARYDFALDDTEITIVAARSGRGIVIEGVLGQLAQDQLTAGDQLRRLLRVGLGLAAVNRSALVVPALREPGALGAVLTAPAASRPVLEVRAVARVADDLRRETVPALRDVLQWRGFSDPILARSASSPDGPGRARSGAAAGGDAGFVIFQP